jgi:hypothetical protein
MQVLDNSKEHHFVPDAARQVALVVRRQPVRGVVRTHHDSLPLTPVPLTVQNFGVLLVGLLLGSRRGLRRWRFIWPKAHGNAGVQSHGAREESRNCSGPLADFLLAYPAGCVGCGIRDGTWTQEAFARGRDRRLPRRSCAFHRRVWPGWRFSRIRWRKPSAGAFTGFCSRRSSR